MRGRRRRRHRAVGRLMARVFVTQPIDESALERLRGVADVEVNPDMRQVIEQGRADRRGALMRYPVQPPSRQHRSRRARGQRRAARGHLDGDHARQHRCRGGDRAAHSGDGGAGDRRRIDRRHAFRPDARGGAPHDRRRCAGAMPGSFPARSRTISSAAAFTARPSGSSAAAAASAKRWRLARADFRCAFSIAGRGEWMRPTRHGSKRATCRSTSCWRNPISSRCIRR